MSPRKRRGERDGSEASDNVAERKRERERGGGDGWRAHHVFKGILHLERGHLTAFNLEVLYQAPLELSRQTVDDLLHLVHVLLHRVLQGLQTTQKKGLASKGGDVECSQNVSHNKKRETSYFPREEGGAGSFFGGGVLLEGIFSYFRGRARRAHLQSFALLADRRLQDSVLWHTRRLQAALLTEHHTSSRLARQLLQKAVTNKEAAPEGMVPPECHG